MQSQPQSPSRTGVLNLLKKKLSKNRRIESGSFNCESNVEFDAQSCIIETVDKSPKHVGIELNVPTSANIATKEPNKVNTYSKEPKKIAGESPLFKEKTYLMKQKVPLLYINNTYDLPPSFDSKSVAHDDDRTDGARDVHADDGKTNERCGKNETTNLENAKTELCTSPGTYSKQSFKTKPPTGPISSSTEICTLTKQRISNIQKDKEIALELKAKKISNSLSNAHALKNAAAVLAKSESGGEDSDEYYITCEVPKPGSVVIDSHSSGALNRDEKHQSIQAANINLQLNENSTKEDDEILSSRKTSSKKVEPPKRISSLTAKSVSIKPKLTFDKSSVKSQNIKLPDQESSKLGEFDQHHRSKDKTTKQPRLTPIKERPVNEDKSLQISECRANNEAPINASIYLGGVVENKSKTCKTVPENIKPESAKDSSSCLIYSKEKQLFRTQSSHPASKNDSKPTKSCNPANTPNTAFVNRNSENLHTSFDNVSKATVFKGQAMTTDGKIIHDNSQYCIMENDAIKKTPVACKSQAHRMPIAKKCSPKVSVRKENNVTQRICSDDKFSLITNRATVQKEANVENKKEASRSGYSSLADVQRYFSKKNNNSATTNSKPEVNHQNKSLNDKFNTKERTIVYSCNSPYPTINSEIENQAEEKGCLKTSHAGGNKREGYITLEEFLGRTSSKQTQQVPPNIHFQNKGARPKQKSGPLDKAETKTTISAFHKGKEIHVNTQLDVNLNKYQREASHESGYDTCGSGKRSHSSSSNEFLQHDFSNYSLLSECTDDSFHQHTLPPPPPRPANDPLKETQAGNTYALVPKPVVKTTLALFDERAADIKSPDSATHESTLTEASLEDEEFADSGNEEPFSFTHDDDEDLKNEPSDYLPPIPMRNYDSEETVEELGAKSPVTQSDDCLDGLSFDRLALELKAKDKKRANEIRSENASSEHTSKTNTTSKATNNEKNINMEVAKDIRKENLSPSKLQEVKKMLYSPIHKVRSGNKTKSTDPLSGTIKQTIVSLGSKVLSNESNVSIDNETKKGLVSKHDKVSPLEKITHGNLSGGSHSSFDSLESTPKSQNHATISPSSANAESERGTDSETYVPGSFSSDSTASNDTSFWASFDEPVHMSWDEVKSQAEELGIPLTAMQTNRAVTTSPSVHNNRSQRATQTLQCPKSRIDKNSKFGTLKDKFASLFLRRNTGDRSGAAVQHRMLPLPPNRRVTQGRADKHSPAKRTRSPCQVHKVSPIATLRPRDGGACSPIKCHHSCTDDSKDPRMTQSYHHDCASSTSSWSCDNTGARTHAKCFHRTSDSAIHDKNTCGTMNNAGHGNSPIYPKAAFPIHQACCPSSQTCCCQFNNSHSHDSVCHSDHSATANRRTRTECHEHTRRRERSQSREQGRRRSPHVSSPLRSSSQGPHCCCAHQQDDSPRKTRSCSSSGIVERCPPSPAPSSATSIMSAPSAFNPQASTPPAAPPTRPHAAAPATVSNADFLGSLCKLRDVGWYWGPLGWDEAETKLVNQPDGAFLVRDSSDDRYILSLSFRSQGATHHTRIEHYKGMFSFYSQPKSHGAATIIEFIEKAMEHSRSGKFLYFLRPRAPGLPPAPVQLLLPISRFRTMQTLQHSCRFEILKHVRRDHIDRLPVPQKIKDYLEESQYYIESLEHFSHC